MKKFTAGLFLFIMYLSLTAAALPANSEDRTAAVTELSTYEDLQMLHEKIMAMNSKCCILPDGTVTSWRDADAETKELVRQYECIQYNNLVEKSRRIDWFFRTE